MECFIELMTIWLVSVYEHLCNLNMLHCPIHSLSPGKLHLSLCQHHTDFWGGGGVCLNRTRMGVGWRGLGGWGSQRDMHLKVTLLEFVQGMTRKNQCQKYLGSINIFF